MALSVVSPPATSMSDTKLFTSSSVSERPPASASTRRVSRSGPGQPLRWPICGSTNAHTSPWAAMPLARSSFTGARPSIISEYQRWNTSSRPVRSKPSMSTITLMGSQVVNDATRSSGCAGPNRSMSASMVRPMAGANASSRLPTNSGATIERCCTCSMPPSWRMVRPNTTPVERSYGPLA